MRKVLKDKRNLLILLLTILFLLKTFEEEKRFIIWIAIGVLSSVFFDFLINKLFFAKKIFSRSALITGFIIAGVLDYSQAIYKLIILCFLAIISKYLLRHHQRHIFNPANLSLFLASSFKLALTWTIESNILLIFFFGVYFAYTLKKFPHLLGYFTSFVPLFILAKINPFSIISWFFVFVMLIEPKTSGNGILRGFIFGGVCGIFSFLVFKFLPQMDYYVSSLFFTNLLNPFLARISRR